MILPFSQRFKDGTPTYFIEKIWAGLCNNYLDLALNMLDYFQDYEDKFGCFWDGADDITLKPKLTTIRTDIHERWHAGRLIHPVINNRSKNQFQFAPVFPCVSTQKIEIRKTDDKLIIAHYIDRRWGFAVAVDGQYVNNDVVEKIAINDGFRSVSSFFKWFNKDYTGKIIHWTNLKY